MTVLGCGQDNTCTSNTFLILSSCCFATCVRTLGHCSIFMVHNRCIMSEKRYVIIIVCAECVALYPLGTGDLGSV